jgi:uncharacterized protein YqgC (DUF456 family)
MFELLVVSLVIVGIGLIGTVVPGLPGMPLVLGGVALFTLGTGFAVIGPLQFAAMVALGLVGIALNLFGNLVGARTFGASRAGLVGALAGLAVGLVLLGPFGIVIGPLVGAVAAELLRGRATEEALKSGLGVLVGYFFGALAEALIALIVVGWFLWSTRAVLFGPTGPLGGFTS